MNAGDKHAVRAAVAGVVAGGVGLAVSELVAAVIAPAASTIFAGGAAVVDTVPPWLKDLAIEWFGTADKAVLLGSMGVVLAAGAALAGLLERRRAGFGAALLALVGVAGVAVALARPASTVLWALPSMIGVAVAVPVLRAAIRALGGAPPSPRTGDAAVGAGEGADVRGTAGSGGPSGAVGAGGAAGTGGPGGSGGAGGAAGAGSDDAGGSATTGGGGAGGLVGADGSGGGAVGGLPGAGGAGRPAPSSDLDRRRFLRITGLGAAGALVALGVSGMIGAGGRAVEAARETFRLPGAARRAAPIPAGAELPVPGITPYITPNDVFYRIDTALRVPEIDPGEWTLRVTGMVDEPFELTWDDLVELPMREHHATLACVSNTVGGDLIGNALWLGHPIRELLARAKPQAGADMVLSRSSDGWTAGTPLEVLRDPDRESLLAIGMNGEPLPLRHGFPARLVVPGLYGYVSATKWVTELEVTTFERDEGYWTPRGWSALGPVKVQSRIDVARATTGGALVAGIAWAQHTGISGVEVRADDGDWVGAELAEVTGTDTWVQWRVELDLEPGEHTVTVRATDADGETQTADQAPPAPDGATGWHSTTLTI